MSQISFSDVKLKPLSYEDIELVRSWRNKVHVRNMMEFKDIITLSQQKKWFQNLDKKKNQYFTFLVANEPVGLIHLKNIQANTAEVGMFIGNIKFLGTGISIFASILILDLAFNKLRLDNLSAKVNKSNNNALRYNSFLGFRSESGEQESFVKMILPKERYLDNKNKILALINN